MSTFASQFLGSGIPLLIASHGVSADYYAPGSSSADPEGISVLLARMPAGLEIIGEQHELSEYPATIHALESELTTAALDGLFAVGSDWWRITRPPVLDGGIWRCECARAELESIGTKRRKQ